MKPNKLTENEDGLRILLRKWKVDSLLPPQFQEGVWRRIAAAEAAPGATGPWQNLSAALERLFVRPAFVASSVAVFLVFGLTVGWAQAREEAAGLDAKLGARYVQSVDPYQAPRP